MTEPRPIYCPMCRAQLCTSPDPTKPKLYFGCEECGALFRILIQDPDLSEALRMLRSATQ
jgi:hypothetical protein